MTIEEKNHGFCNETMELKNTIEISFLEMGKRLKAIRDGKLYRPYWDGFEDYLMEMKWDKTKGSRIIGIYETFVLKYKIEPRQLALAGGWSNLSEVLPAVKAAGTKEAAEHWVQKCIDNPQYELREEVSEAIGRKKRVPLFEQSSRRIVIWSTGAGEADQKWHAALVDVDAKLMEADVEISKENIVRLYWDHALFDVLKQIEEDLKNDSGPRDPDAPDA